MIILDTNVLSELMRPAPERAVLAWMEDQPASLLFTTAIAEAEIFYGLALLPKGRRRRSIEQAAHLMFTEDFTERVLPFDSAAAREFATITATRRVLGRPLASLDAQIAAIARAHRAAVATRNTTDFEACGVDLVNPWSV